MTKIKKSQVERYTIRGENIDPVCVTIEGGKVDISASGLLGSYYWGCTGKDTVQHFLIDIGFDYWVGKLFSNKKEIFLYDETIIRMKEMIFNYRKCDDIDKKSAREIFDKLQYMGKDTTNDENHFFVMLVDNDIIDGENINYMDIEICTDYDPIIYHVWFKAWLPFIEYLCERIRYRKGTLS